MLKLVTFEPEPYPENWQPALSICAISDEKETFCHAALPSDQFCLSAIAAGVVIFLPLVGIEGGVPLVPIRWALKHSPIHRKTLRRIDKLLRGVHQARMRRLKSRTVWTYSVSQRAKLRPKVL